jgi:hypothetical protein
VEAQASEQDLREAFASIEVAVEKGEHDLRRLGFWKRVAQVKRTPETADRWADQIARIDRVAFERGVRLRVPVWVGNALLLGGVVLGAAAVAFALRAGPTAAALSLLVAGGVWSVSTHCLTHYVVGRAVGIRFTNYFMGGPFPPRPGLKTDYASYLRTSPTARAVMHASGAIASKLSPFVALGFAPATDARWWGPVGLLALGVLQIVTDVVFSVKSSDWKKVKRERAIARAWANAR